MIILRTFQDEDVECVLAAVGLGTAELREKFHWDKLDTVVDEILSGNLFSSFEEAGGDYEGYDPEVAFSEGNGEETDDGRTLREIMEIQDANLANRLLTIYLSLAKTYLVSGSEFYHRNCFFPTSGPMTIYEHNAGSLTDLAGDTFCTPQSLKTFGSEYIFFGNRGIKQTRELATPCLFLNHRKHRIKPTDPSTYGNIPYLVVYCIQSKTFREAVYQAEQRNFIVKPDGIEIPPSDLTVIENPFFIETTTDKYVEINDVVGEYRCPGGVLAVGPIHRGCRFGDSDTYRLLIPTTKFRVGFISKHHEIFEESPSNIPKGD